MPDWVEIMDLLQLAFEKEGYKGVVQIQLEPEGNGQLVWRFGALIEEVRCSWSNIEEMEETLYAYLDREKN